MLFDRNTIKISLVVTVILILYFLAIAFTGHADQVYLSFLNAPIVAVGIYFIIRDIYLHQPKTFKYMDGFLSGLAAGFLISILYTVFMSIYLFEVNPDLIETLNKTIPIATGTGTVGILLFVFLSGISTAIVSSLLIIPIFKQSWNTKEVREGQNPMNQN